MPEMDGVDVCRRVRARETLQPPYMILLTALGDKDSVVTGLEAGADDYVGKPYDPDELRARLEVGRRLVELNDELLEAQHALEILARTDALTGVLNRGAIVEELEREVERARREGESARPRDARHRSLQAGQRYVRSRGRRHGASRGGATRAGRACDPTTASGASAARSSSCSCRGPAEKELKDVLERIRRAIASTPIVVERA